MNTNNDENGDYENKVTEFARSILKATLDEMTIRPERIQYSKPIQKSGTWVVHCSVEKCDAGKVNGKKGMHWKAVQTLIEMIGMRYRVPLTATWADTGVGEEERFDATMKRILWDDSKVKKLITQYAKGCFSNEVKVEFNDLEDNETHITIILSDGENPRNVQLFTAAMGVILKPIGNKNGRKFRYNFLGKPRENMTGRDESRLDGIR